jgi:hypothetical protein
VTTLQKEDLVSHAKEPMNSHTLPASAFQLGQNLVACLASDSFILEITMFYFFYDFLDMPQIGLESAQSSHEQDPPS